MLKYNSKEDTKTYVLIGYKNDERNSVSLFSIKERAPIEYLDVRLITYINQSIRWISNIVENIDVQ